MGISTTAERLIVVKPAHKITKRKAANSSSLTRDQFIKDIKASQARFERGEYNNNSVWALEEEARAYADRLMHK